MQHINILRIFSIFAALLIKNKKMNKILKSLFTLLLIFAVSSTFACGTCGCQDTPPPSTTTEVQSSDAEKKTCESSTKTSLYNSDKQNAFNFNKSNNYGNKKTSCSKSVKKKCCKTKSSTEEAEASTTAE